MSLFSTLNIARQALYTSQFGLQVTGQNIANVNTQGYKRQRVEQANLPYGMGVTVQSVNRMQNGLLDKQLLGITSDAACTSATSGTYTQLENLFNETSGQGLSTEFKSFFQAVQDLTSGPGGTAERATLRSQANSLGTEFSFLYGQMTSQMKDQDVNLDNAVKDANGLISQIAELNRHIGAGVGNDLGVNELRNNRDEAVRKLSELMPISTMEDINGNFSVFIDKGMPLVSGSEVYQLETEVDPTNQLKKSIFWVTDDGTRQDVTAQMTSGSIGGAIANRDVNIPEQMDKLDRLAAELVLKFNQQHRAGTGLDGVSGRDFFEPTPVYTELGKGTQGGANVTAASVVNESALTLDDYEVRFTANGAGFDYAVVDKTTGGTVSSGAYTSGNAITFDGISITLSNVSGPPQDGDTIRVNTVTNAAANIKVSDAIRNSLDAIGAGLSGQSGDNQNALALANLQNARVASGGTMSFMEMYQAQIVELGVASSSAQNQNSTNSALLTQASNMVSSVSGVSIDEEATNLMQYQQAYQAASKLISTVDEMLQTLMQAF